MTQTTYAIELSYESGRTEEIALKSTTDSQAEREMRKYLKAKSKGEDVNAFLSFFRKSDGQHGYLNQDGASPTGKAWSKGA